MCVGHRSTLTDQLRRICRRQSMVLHSSESLAIEACEYGRAKGFALIGDDAISEVSPASNAAKPASTTGGSVTTVSTATMALMVSATSSPLKPYPRLKTLDSSQSTETGTAMTVACRSNAWAIAA